MVVVVVGEEGSSSCADAESTTFTTTAPTTTAPTRGTTTSPTIYNTWNKEIVAIKRRVDQQVGQTHNRWSAAVAGLFGTPNKHQQQQVPNNNNTVIAFEAAKQSQHVRRQNQKVLLESASVRSKASETTVPLSNRTEHVLTARRSQQQHNNTTSVTPIVEDEPSCSSGTNDSVSIVVHSSTAIIPTVKGTFVQPAACSPERPTWQQQQQPVVLYHPPQQRPQPEPTVVVVRANPQPDPSSSRTAVNPRMSPERRLSAFTTTAAATPVVVAPVVVAPVVGRPQLAPSHPARPLPETTPTTTPVTIGRDVRPPSPIEIAARNRIASLRESLREDPVAVRRRQKDAPEQRRPDAPTTTSPHLRPRPELSLRSGGKHHHDEGMHKKDTSVQHSLVETSCSDDNEDAEDDTVAQRQYQCSSPVPMDTILECNLISSPFSHLTTTADMRHHRPMLVPLKDPEEKKEPDADMITHDHATATKKHRPKHDRQGPNREKHERDDISNHAVATTKHSNLRPRQTEEEDHHNVQLVHNHPLTDPYGDTGRYTGILVHNRPHDSHGTMQYDRTNPQRITYTGGWHRGRWHGHGMARFANGDSYTGTYVADVRQGPGRYTWADGRIFDGQFADDQRQGKGTYRWPDGSVYMGKFVNGLRDGEGTLTFASSSIYTGEWKEGKQHGQGECVWPDGRCYRGEWVKGQAHGYGVEVRADGSIRHDGRWDKDRPVRTKQKPSTPAGKEIDRHHPNISRTTKARGKHSPIEVHIR